MPIYEYRCRECGWLFEKLSKMEESEGPIECPRCGRKKAERILSTFCCSNTSESPSSCGSTGSSSPFS